MADALFGNALSVTFNAGTTDWRLVMDSTIEEQLAVLFMTARATGDEVTSRSPNGLVEDAAISGTILTNTAGWGTLSALKGTEVSAANFLIQDLAGPTNLFAGKVMVDFPTVRRQTNGAMEIDFVAYLQDLPTTPDLSHLAVA
ncbi:MAG: hypothetical protein MOGMAGMI_02480 [Candidatus Omnitrophica bacterium]|nr:hypothetical protein [Candidatus Omnitrophota bacterium]